MKFLFLVTVLTVLGCSPKEQVDNDATRDEILTDNPSKILTNSTPLAVDVDLNDREPAINATTIMNADRKIIKLETNNDCLIGEISKVIIEDDKIFIFDAKIAKKLFCFDLQGKHLFTVGTIGGGPGEMDTPKDFDVTNGKIYIIDRQSRVFTFTLAGKHQSTLRLPFFTTQLCALNDSSVFYYTGSITESFKYYLTQINESTVRSFDFPIQSSLVGMYDIPQAFHKRDNRALFVKFLCDTIFTLSDNKVIPSYVMNFPGEYSNSVFYSKKELEKVYSDPNTYGKLFNMHMAETNKDLFFLSSSNGINYHFLSKNTRKHIFTGSVNDDFLFGGLTFMFPVGSYQEYLIYPIAMSDMINSYKVLVADARSKGLEEEFKKNYVDFSSLCEGSDEDDNPALLLSGINPKLYEE